MEGLIEGGLTEGSRRIWQRVTFLRSLLLWGWGRVWEGGVEACWGMLVGWLGRDSEVVSNNDHANNNWYLQRCYHFTQHNAEGYLASTRCHKFSCLVRACPNHRYLQRFATLYDILQKDV